ncbi:peptide-methionine (S)-S-oxide reductase MsrA [uncultured Tateyamaria sp.]|uniref:peptide-methionine (S)-S-oxide reductase MsrA n=1 Tax=uncultured Tateyamaria sp. TaxID=455651 RepID=UPI002603B407|nr:peptide-methionine (S)-S-oxide reductase MsrA [uncultured Tateyamaria sp.]
MTSLRTLKTISLGLMIALGLLAQSKTSHAQQLETITVAGGCFWCVEADFEKVSGVTEAVSGFAGGSVANPTYKQVVSGRTGHYEAVQITYDPSKVSAETLYDLFFRSVDPTDAGGQFCDRGDSYRTAIFASPDQKAAAEAAKAEAQADLGQTIVTPILDAAEFYPADGYHQDYYKQSGLILTRFGPKSKANAYKAYREACGRDARVKQLWGDAAPFAGS